MNHTYTQARTHVRKHITSWSRTFCSYSPYLLAVAVYCWQYTNRRMKERKKIHTYAYRNCCCLLLIMHINLNETTETFVYSCRCYSVHAVDWMNKYVCACTRICVCMSMPYNKCLSRQCHSIYIYRCNSVYLCIKLKLLAKSNKFIRSYNVKK